MSTFNMSFFDIDTARRNLSRDCVYVVGYARLSFDEDGSNFASIENQQSILRQTYDNQFSSTTSQYQFIFDDGFSGYKFDRPGMMQIYKLIEQGKCNVILAKDLSRIGRHGALLQLFIEQCESIGITIHAMEDYQSHKESDDLILGIKAWTNERLVKEASAKLRKIIHHKQANGTWLCSVPFGYVIADMAHQKIEIDPESAEIVRRIYSLYIGGYGVNKIARILTSDHTPTNNMLEQKRYIEKGLEYHKPVSDKWNISTITRILHDEFYIGTLITGRYTRKGINGRDIRTDPSQWYRFPNHHEAIITKEMFDQVQMIKKDRGNYHYRYKNEPKYLFRGLIQCAECGQNEYGTMHEQNKVVYICSSYIKYTKSVCSRHCVPEPLLIDIAIDILQLIKETYQRDITALDAELFGNTKKKNEQDNIAILQQKLSRLEQQIVVIEDQRIKQLAAHPDRADRINTTYDALTDKNYTEQQQLQMQIDMLENMKTTEADVRNKAKRTMEIIDHIIQTRVLTRPQVLALFKKIIVREDGYIQLYLRPNLEHVQGIGQIVYRIISQPGKPTRLAKQYIATSSGANGETSVNIVHGGDPLETILIQSPILHLLRLSIF